MFEDISEHDAVDTGDAGGGKVERFGRARDHAIELRGRSLRRCGDDFDADRFDARPASFGRRTRRAAAAADVEQARGRVRKEVE